MLKASRWFWFCSGLVVGLTALSLTLASNSVVSEPELSEVKINHEKDLSFDSEVYRLSQLEGNYKNESLPRINHRSGHSHRKHSQRSHRKTSRRSHTKISHQPKLRSHR